MGLPVPRVVPSSASLFLACRGLRGGWWTPQWLRVFPCTVPSPSGPLIQNSRIKHPLGLSSSRELQGWGFRTSLMAGGEYCFVHHLQAEAGT